MEKRAKFHGSMPALVTPFKDGKIDWQSLEALVEFHIKHGTNGIVPCGTTGESATLDHKEHHEVVERVIKTVNKRVPVIAGTGSNSTAEFSGTTLDSNHNSFSANMFRVGVNYWFSYWGP